MRGSIISLNQVPIPFSAALLVSLLADLFFPPSNQRLIASSLNASDEPTVLTNAPVSNSKSHVEMEATAWIHGSGCKKTKRKKLKLQTILFSIYIYIYKLMTLLLTL